MKATHLKYSSLGLTYVLLVSTVMFMSLLRFPTALADRQKDEFLTEVMFLSRRMHESVPITNQHRSTGRDWQS